MSAIDDGPVGYVVTRVDGTIVDVNATLLGWIGCERDAVVGAKRFRDLLTVAGRVFYELRCEQLLYLGGEVRGVSLELALSEDSALPVLISSVLDRDGDGEPTAVRTSVTHARALHS